MMQLRSLCLLLPGDSDKLDSENHHCDDLKIPTKKNHHHHRHHCCPHQILNFFHQLRRSLIHTCHRDSHRKKQKSFAIFRDAAGVELIDKVGQSNPRIFSYAELYIGSNGFSKDQVLGSGGFGVVYRAVLPSDTTVVAVKCVVEKGEGVHRFEKSFAAELVAVAHLRHRNLVRLRGWCVHEDQLLLVYDYMPNLSLDRVLFRRPEKVAAPPLSWERRQRIVRGLAAALFYLHEQLETQIIHRDVKTSNVMLDSGYNARLGDFGLARWLEHPVVDQAPTHTPSMKNQLFRLEGSTRNGGTIGYLPPESFQTQSVTTAKSDVFSFGIVVLEVASGRRAMDLTYPDDQIILLDWSRRQSDEGKLLQVGDDRLPDESYRLLDMERLIQVGLLCTLHNPTSRPNMKWVIEALSGEIFGEFPALPLFQSQPLYFTLSTPSNTTTTTTITTTTTTTATLGTTMSNYVTAVGETIFITAENKKPTSWTLPTFETPREIPYKEVVSATNNFSDTHRVAELDFGTAYHGILEKHQYHVLVKRLGMKTCPALRTRFTNELQNIGRLRHRNLVQLRGWCTEQGEMLVIYDYTMSRLLSHLLFHDNSLILQWRDRYNIIKSLASAILYLHEEWEEQVIHRNITSSSVMIDSDMNPRLTSFALAEFLTRNEHEHHPVDETNRSVRGIFGYMSPEYMKSGEATPLGDVYSFGVVVLEVVTGQMAVDFRRPEVVLVKRAREFEERKSELNELVDRRLDGEYDCEEMVRLVRLGMACTHSDPELRPGMRQIVSILDGKVASFKKDWRIEGIEEWKERNACLLSLIKRIQALGIQ